MIQTARQLKDLIRNLSKENRVEAHILIRNYMMERFLERMTLSSFRDNFVLKGGMLVAAMVGIDARATMDMDATVRDAAVSVEAVESMIGAMTSVQLDDGVQFHVKRISEIMEDAEYTCVRVSLEAEFDGVITPLKIDISTGDAITPHAVEYPLKLMLENRTITVWAYSLETVLAEKLETVITRTVTNTRMRDYYDLYILEKLHGRTIDSSLLSAALTATATQRNTLALMQNADVVLREIAASPAMQKLWHNYQQKYRYAAGIEWRDAVASVRVLCENAELIQERPSILAQLQVHSTKAQEHPAKRRNRDD